jgi:hypothetical protein
METGVEEPEQRLQRVTATNCARPELQFTILVLDPITEFPTYASIGLSEVTYIVEDQIEGVCLFALTYSYSDDGVFQQNSQGYPVAMYNGQPVFEINIDWEIQPHNVYLLFNADLNRWEVWRNFIDGQPSCAGEGGNEFALSSVCFTCNGSRANIPMIYSETPDLFTTTWTTDNEEECPYTGVLNIDEIQPCTLPEVVTETVTDCWVITELQEFQLIDFTAIEVTTYEDCEDCLFKRVTIAENCENQSVIYLPPGNLSGVIVNLNPPQGAINCWTLSQGEVERDTPVVEAIISSMYLTCEDCSPVPPTPLPIDCDLPLLYRLEDCLGRGRVLFTRDGGLEDFVGQIVRSEYYNECFRVFPAEELNEDKYTLNFEVDGVFENCYDCLPKKPIEPWMNEECCDEQTIQEVVCDYTDGVYRDIVGSRFGIQTIDKEEQIRKEIRFEALRNKLLCLPYPLLPEPEITEDCIVIEQPCVPVQNDCVGCNEPNTIINEPCIACPDSPHDCHTYEITVSQEIIDQATGNTNLWLNEKVLFTYFPCGQIESLTTPIREESTEEFCVLGVPLLGYYQNNVFVPITVERGEICEPEENNTCCDNN